MAAPSALPGPLERGLQLAALACFALAAPLLDLLGRNPEFLVAHRVEGPGVAALALALAWGLPALAASVVLVAQRLAPAAAGGLQAVAVAALVALAALAPLARGLGAGPAAALALAAGAAAGIAYRRLAPVRLFTTALAAGLIAFPALFLARPGVRALLPAADDRPVLGAGVRDPAPVVFVVFDALPLGSLLDADGEIDAARLPHFAALARESTWFRNATAVAARTSDALPALLTGRWPEARRPPTAAAHPVNLFTLLAPSHALHVVEPFTHLCPAPLCGAGPGGAGLVPDLLLVGAHALLPPAWASGLPPVDQTWRDFGADALRERRGDVGFVFERFEEGIDGARPATLHFVHLMLPHAPFQYLPSGAVYGPLGARRTAHGARGGRWGSDAWEVTQALQRHLLQVGYADTLLGRLRARLEAEGLWERALVVVTADHGAAFRPGAPLRALEGSGENAGEILPIPLFVKLPGQRVGRVSDRNVESVDVLATVLDALGGRSPAPLDGHSALDPDAPERPRKTAFRDGPGGRQRVSLPRVLPGRNESARRIARLFDAGHPEGLYRVGPHRELLGRAISDLPVDPAPAGAAALDEADAFARVDPEGPFLPAHVTAALPDARAGDPPLSVAVAVNGIVEAVSRSYAEGDGSVRVSAVIPPRALRPGANRVELFRVEPSGAGAGSALRPFAAREAERWAVGTDPAGAPALVASSRGAVYPLVAGAVTGAVEPAGAIFQGRAVDARRDAAADAVLLFDDGRFLYARPLGADDDGAPTLRGSVFRFVIPFARLGDVSGRSLAFVGLAPGAASLLDYGSASHWRARWPGPAQGVALARRDGREGALVAGAGGSPLFVPVVTANGPVGRLERAAAEGGRARASGWVRDPAAAVLVFGGGRLLGRLPVAPGDGGPGRGRFDGALPFSGGAPPALRVFAPAAAGLVELEAAPAG